MAKIKAHLQRGDIYEVNYCQAFEGEIELKRPFETWLALLQNAKAPFSAYCKYKDWHLLCASPERYLKKKGSQLISQPIKGTVRRGANQEEDEVLKKQLFHSPKERAENVMIVDLVRNDFSRIAQRDSVKVSELFGLYSFETVHHLISTITCTIDSQINLPQIIQATFPMGSMTGAPKISAMQIAEDLESFERGWYSGSVGFVSPQGDFDFNVIIRSIIYNAHTQKAYCAVGGAITVASDSEQEYQETLLKANLLRQTI